MSTDDLGHEVLRSVSRSFYLSIRILPGALQAPIGLAYLLARASDTIADSSDLPAAEREEHLASFLRMAEGGERTGLGAIRERVRSEHAGENQLIAGLDRCLDWLETLSEFDRSAIRQVLAKIVHGQRLDVQRFGSTGELQALKTAGELEEYAYLVAGCVGEFWTDVCLHHIPRYSRMEKAPLRELGRDFGKALQFVNILRDLPADLTSGRCYLPSEEIDPSALRRDPAGGRECFDRWLVRASALLDSGRTYIESLQPVRVRVACFLPWSLGRQTLALLRLHYPLETSLRVKVSRAQVRVTMLRALWAGFSNAALS